MTVGYDRPVLTEVNLSAEAGELLAICGPNASGKSTLLSAALGLLKPTAGTVRWHGTPLQDWPRRELSKRVAFLPQRPTAASGHRVGDVLLSGRSPHWNVFGSEEASAGEIVREVATRLDLVEMIGRPMHTLSGGQRQRVFIGRSLVQIAGAAAPVLVLDEPDASLDIAQGVRLMRLLREIVRGGTAVLLVTHHLDHAAAADRVALVDHGRVHVGNAEAILTAEQLTRAFDVPLRVVEAGGQRLFLPDS